MRDERPRQVRALRTRERIIQTAAVAFAERGFEGVSLTDLVQASGLSKGAFYHHFASKHEVALATFRAKQQELIDRLLQGDQAPATATEQVAALVRRRATLVAGDPSLHCVVRLGNELNVRSEPGSEYVSFQDLALGLIADVLRAGQRSGEFRGDVDSDAAARAIFAWIVGLDTLSLLFSAGKDLEGRSEEMLALLLPALASTATRPSRPRGPLPA